MTKKVIALLVVGGVFVFSNTAFADDNSNNNKVTLEQVGSGHSMDVTLSYGSVTQKGSANVVDAEQVKSDSKYRWFTVNQDGKSNVAKFKAENASLTQKGDNNSAIVDKDKDAAKTLTVYHIGNKNKLDATLVGKGNSLTSISYGDNLNQKASVKGKANYIGVYNSGDNNSVTDKISGDSNYSYTSIDGDGNAVEGIQTGNNNSATKRIYTDNVTLKATQTGNKNYLKATVK